MSPDRFVQASRLLTGLILGALVVLGLPGNRPDTALRVSSGTSAEALARALVSDGDGPITYADSIAPTRRVTGLLAAGAAKGRDVSLVVPGLAPRISVSAPADPVARRRTALAVTVRGEPGGSVRVTIRDGAGQTDTLTVSVGPTGTARTAIAIEPAREGTERWTLATGGDTAVATARVRPAEPLRVLVLSGTPDGETRYLVRALESSGMEVSVRQDLGRSVIVSSDPELTGPGTIDLARFDVVVASADQAASRLRALDGWVRSSGGGLLILEGETPGEAEAAIAATELTWSGPAELLPLPAIDLDVTGSPLTEGQAQGAVAVAAVGDAVLVSASLRGRGRLLRSGLATWPWVLAGGAADAHAAWWESAVEWLGGGLTADALLAGPPVQPWTAWDGRIEGEIPTRLTIHDDTDGVTVDVLRLAADRGRVSLVPTGTGAHPASSPEGSTRGAVMVMDGAELLDWSEAALEVGGSGGSIVASDGATRLADAGSDPGGGRRLLAFLVLVALVGATWITRRLRGLA